MRAEAVSWDDWSVSNPPQIVDEEKWHVQFAPDKVKIVSLEQMDDLFRLSIIDSETPVWQAGMREWQPLRVIAGLEEEPTPQPQRSYPKPPAPPSVRPAPPAPRLAAGSVRPPAPERRPAPPPARPAYVEPTSFYTEPVHAAAAPYASAATYAAPIAFAAPVNAMNSVRPLVVSHLPPPARSGGGGFGRFLVGVSLLAGVAVTAYRNDFVREGAHAAHQDALYARLEGALGGPAFGTVRALEQSAAAQPVLEPLLPRAVPVEPARAEPLASPPVVTLESLSAEKSGSVAPIASAKTGAEPLPQRHIAPPVAAETPPPAAKNAAVAKPAAKKIAAVEKPTPVPQKSESEMTDRDRLNAAIGRSMATSPSASKSTKAAKSAAKSKGNEYDPLNPQL